LCLALLVACLPAPASGADADAQRIVVNIPSCTLSLYAGEALVRRYPVAVGHPLTPTPLGQTRVAVKVVLPTWYPKRRPPVPPGPDNPVGTRWLGLALPDLGIHGTNNPASIGRVVSGGCIRMHNVDVEELFGLVEEGTPVELTYERLEVGPLPAGEETVDLGYAYGLAIQPDPYRRTPLTEGDVREFLLDRGITAELEGTRLERQLREAQGMIEPLPVAPRVVVEGRPARMVRWREGRLWLPLAEAAELTGEPLLAWAGEVWELDDLPWVAAEEVAQRLGYRRRAVPQAAALYLTTPLVFLGETPVARAFSEGDDLLVPVEELGRACERQVDVDPRLLVASGADGRTENLRWRAEKACLDPWSAASLLGLDVTVTPEGVWFANRAALEGAAAPAAFRLEELRQELGGQFDLHRLLELRPVPGEEG
jgi:hypothetical protein